MKPWRIFSPGALRRSVPILSIISTVMGSGENGSRIFSGKRGWIYPSIRKWIFGNTLPNMPECLAAADLVICRAGAITLSELQAQGKAAILIPSPNVAENHQYHNAMALVKRQAAAILEEKDLTGEALCQMVNKLFAEKDTIGTLAENARKMAITDANERIYNILLEVLKENKKGVDKRQWSRTAFPLYA